MRHADGYYEPTERSNARIKASVTPATAEERVRIGNTPTCEDCNQPLESCTCDESEELLEAAKEAQTTYWNALRELEDATGLEIDSTSDLTGWTVATLRKSADGDDSEEDDDDEQEIPTCEACGCTDGTCQHAS